MGFYARCKSVYRHVLPAPVRHWMFTRYNPASRIIFAVKGMMEQTAAHDEIYDETYYGHVDQIMAGSCEAISESIVEHFQPKTVLDVGCGTGGLIMALRARGVNAFGLEYSQAALRLCRARGLDVRQFDLEHDSGDGRKVDVVVSLEVAEHLPEHIADRFVDLLCASAPIVVMTAATPGQGGTDHVNEQPHEYWIEKFAKRGLTYQKDASMEWRALWTRLGAAPCYCANVMIFRTAVSSLLKIDELGVTQVGQDIPMPEPIATPQPVRTLVKN
jgi:SAM-dependent methyltransferase